MKKITAILMIAMMSIQPTTAQAATRILDPMPPAAAGCIKHLRDFLEEGLNTTDTAPEDPEAVIDEEEVDLLAHLIIAEMGYDTSERAYYYTGSVVLNRMASDEYPDTLYGVIYQRDPIQYACIEDGNINKEPTDVVYEIAEDLLINGSVLPENVVYQSEFTQGSGIYDIIGNTYFCYQ